MQNDVLFSSFKKAICARYGEDAGKRIWQDAEKEYTRLKIMHPALKGDGKNMLTVGAIYLAMNAHDSENALPFLCECGRQSGVKLGKLMHAITSIPGLPELLWKHMPSLARSMSSEEKGYAGSVVVGDNEIGVDIHVCPIHEAAKEMGIPEAARIICAMDKAYMTGFKHIDYTRTMALAEGDPCCDYRLAYNAQKQ